jgi:ribose transport system ATP-binding protein
MNPTMSHPLVSMHGLCKSFGSVTVLQDVQFELRAGEVHALMGENGAGKSTLMKILSGVYARDAGDIRVNGMPVALESPRAAQMLGIQIIHQELQLMPHLSAAQNVWIGREPRRWGGLLLDEDEMNRRTATLFARLRLDLDPRTTVGELTVARQQMVEIAKALSHDSRVLIMDEPTAALTDTEVEELFRVINELRAQGVGIVYISHKMDELKRIADRVTVMRDGRWVSTLPMAETPVTQIIALMVGRELDTDHAVPVPRTGQPVALEVRGLQRGKLVRDVSFAVHRGEILGFAGLMGAGRTEVARAIFGADTMQAGELWVHGQPVRIRTPRDAVRCGIGYLSEDRKRFGLATGLDVQTNILLATLPRFARGGFWLDEAAMARTAQELVQRLAVKTPSIAQQVGLLSGGNQQKIVIAKWLLRDCDILFFDEPTRGIDVGAKREIYRLIEALAADGKAVVVISSELPEVLRLSHRVLVMCEGRISGELAAAEATQQRVMQLATRGAQLAA